MFLSQLKGGTIVCRVGDEARMVNGVKSTYQLAMEAIGMGVTISDLIKEKGLGDSVNLESLLVEGLIDSPISHPDYAHMTITGTGLTHLGSASARDAMHKALEGESDSMKMFRMGLVGGKPESGDVGVQPEWFYKGNGKSVVAPSDALASPSFALDGSEEPEIAGIYVNSPEGKPFRIGYALANEFSDHITERINYLYLAHSKLRQTSFGPEIMIGDLPADIRGTSRIKRNGSVLWEKPFLSGEDNMSHTISNLEYHHFKYDIFREPGDLNVHMFGTATLSFADGVSVLNGDVMEVECPTFGLTLSNPVSKLAVPMTAIGVL